MWLIRLLLLACVLLAGCGGGGSSDPVATVKGVVYASDGSVLAGVTVSSGVKTTTSGADGSYALSLSPGLNLRVTANKSGMVGTQDAVTLSNGQTVVLDFALLPVGATSSLSNMQTQATQANTLTGAVVDLAANSIVIEGTNTPVDSAQIEVTNAMPGDARYTAAFPGDFVGNKAGQDIAIESFGYARIDISSNGQKCNLAEGKTANIAIPVASGADPGTPTIDLWSLDETASKWIYEGVATRDASGSPVVYRGTVSHFSTYNLDRAIPDAIPFNVTVKNAAGAAVAGAAVVITATSSSGGVWEGRGVSDSSGKVRFPTVAPGTVSVQVSYGGKTGTGYSYSIENNEAEMQITLYDTLQKTITVVYESGGSEIPAANANISIFSEGASGHDYVQGSTDANGRVSVNLKVGLQAYGYSSNFMVGDVSYTIGGMVNSVNDIPTKWVLAKP